MDHSYAPSLPHSSMFTELEMTLTFYLTKCEEIKNYLPVVEIYQNHDWMQNLIDIIHYVKSFSSLNNYDYCNIVAFGNIINVFKQYGVQNVTSNISTTFSQFKQLTITCKKMFTSFYVKIASNKGLDFSFIRNYLGIIDLYEFHWKSVLNNNHAYI